VSEFSSGFPVGIMRHGRVSVSENSWGEGRGRATAFMERGGELFGVENYWGI